MGKNKQQGGALDIAAGHLMADFAKWASLKSLRGTKRLAFRWRRALTPVWIAGMVWFVSWVCHLTVPEWWPVALAVPTFGIVVAVLGPKLSERWSAIVTRVVPAGLDRERDGVLDRMIERVYFGSLFGTIGLYLTTRIGLGGSDFTLWVWRVGLVCFGGLWWWHRRIRTAGRADRIAKKWTKLGDKGRCPDGLKPFVGSKVTHSYGHGRNVLMRVRLTPGVSVHAVSRLMPGLTSFYRAKPGSIHVREDENAADCIWLTFMSADPWAGKLPHPAPEVGSTSLHAVNKRIAMGILIDDADQIVDLDRHVGVYGQTGGGKSGWLHSLMRWLVGFSDAIIVTIDMANGATMNAWKKALALPVATDLESACVLLERVLAFIEVRERRLGSDDNDDDSFAPTDETPWLFLVIDEFPELITAATRAGMKDVKAQQSWIKFLVGLLDSIAKKARKTGVRVIIGAQNATKPDVGSKEFQAQFTCTIGLSMEAHASKQLWGALERLGWTSTGLTNGQYRQRDAEHSVPEIAKGFWIEKRDQRLAAAKAAELHKMAEEEAWLALVGIEGVQVVMPPTPREHTDAVIRALADGPLTVPELVERTGKSRPTVYRRLNHFGQERDGQPGAVRKLVTGPDAGKYALTRPGADVPAHAPADTSDVS